MVPSYYYNFNT